MKIPKLNNKEIKKLSDSELEVIFSSIEEDYSKYLAEHGVKIPNGIKNNRGYIKKSLQLIFLKINEGKLVHKNQVSDFIGYYENIKDCQVRHLGTQEGWFVLNKGDDYFGEKIPPGFHLLVSTTQPKPSFISDRREILAHASDFSDIKRAYGFMCATCGSREGRPHRHAPEKTTYLQKGHKNPKESLSIENMLPQCQICNQQYLDKVVFDENGRIRALNNASLVKSSERGVKSEILAYLQEEFYKH